MSANGRYVLTVKCPDRGGIVAAVSAFLVREGATIAEMSQSDEEGSFFMRTAFAGDGRALPAIEALRRAFDPIASSFEMDWALRDCDKKPRVLIAVSRFGHCLYDLLHRWKSGQLPADIVGVVSNHDDMRSFVEWNGLPYHHLPVLKDGKAEQQMRLLELIEALDIDLLVLARYMQILSPELCEAVAGRCINIHHSFLPSFKGAKPYHQAHGRGVKLIGATAHYVTTDLDEGPIIEQGVQRIDHGFSAARLVEAGQEIECMVLRRAVHWHLEHRILINGKKTIIFS